MSAEVAVYLRTYLAPLAFLLERPDVTDIFINAPGEAWIETISGKIERHAAPQLNEITLLRLARQIASLSHQGVSREHPLLAATLPDGDERLTKYQIGGCVFRKCGSLASRGLPSTVRLPETTQLLLAAKSSA